MRIGLVTRFDIDTADRSHPFVRGTSGEAFWTLREFRKKGLECILIGPLHTPKSPWWKIRQFYRQKRWGDRYESFAEPLLAQAYAEQIQRLLAKNPVDVILCMDGLMPVAQLSTDCPIVAWVDGTWGGIVDFYDWLTDRPALMISDIAAMERNALTRCSLCIFSSDWAAECARKIYTIPANKIAVIPMGGHLLCTWNQEETNRMILSRCPSPWRLLFLGVDWYRKGGAIALATATELARRGFGVEFFIAGPDRASLPPLPPFARALGFIETQERDRLLRSAHLLILPSRADCSPHALCEAFAYGVPCIASDVGGIPTIVHHGRTGFLLPSGSPPRCLCGCSHFPPFRSCTVPLSSDWRFRRLPDSPLLACRRSLRSRPSHYAVPLASSNPVRLRLLNTMSVLRNQGNVLLALNKPSCFLSFSYPRQKNMFFM